MKIKYIVDSPYAEKFTLTDARDGLQHEITKKIAKDLLDGDSSHETFFSARANIQLRALECKEVIPGTTAALGELLVRA